MMSPLFVSHGSPMIVLDDTAAREHLQQLGRSRARPRAMLVASAHWQHADPLVGNASTPETLHDFGGFDPRLFEMQYPAPGDPGLANHVAELLENADWRSGTVSRGLDHGVWTPLMLMYPEADIPVVPLAVPMNADARGAWQLGRALAELKNENVLVLGSGAFTHNLGEVFRRDPGDANAPGWVTEFVNWMRDRLNAGDVDALLDYRNLAPHAHGNHPTEEHLLPLFIAMGAAGDDFRVEELHASYTHGVLAMDCFAFARA